ncbi:MAG TPA: DUF2249 domain-containing protein [Verrucomicrobiae bacterium]|nr:DUF2249 domain-containing protein [Verrucomicrobiae bacterium]
MKNTTSIAPALGADRVLDVRAIPCSIKHGLILQTFRDLAVGEYFILVNGHDPVPLYYQFSAEWPGTFKWQHLLKLAEEVHVKITKTAALAGVGENLKSCPSATP